MQAVTWQGPHDVQVREVPDPVLRHPTDAIVRMTSTAICGSDLHLYELLGPYMKRGDILGHEGMGIVVDVGSDVDNVAVGDRVVVPFNIACGRCYMCTHGLQSQCETTQVTEHGSGAALLGYSSLYGSVPGAQADLLRVPHADYGLIRVDVDLPDDRYLFLSDILPTAWQAVQYAGVSAGDTLAVFGLGPVGQLVGRIGVYLGATVFGIEPIKERRTMAQRHGVSTFEPGDDAIPTIRDLTQGRGPDAVVDAVGMEAAGNPVASALQHATGALPDAVARRLMETAGVDRLSALHSAIDLIRRGGTVSLAGVYAGAASPMPLLSMFDKQVSLRMGQCNVRSWTDDLLPLAEADSDPLGLADLVTHHLPLTEAPDAYELFQKKNDGCIKVVLHPVEAAG